MNITVIQLKFTCEGDFSFVHWSLQRACKHHTTHFSGTTLASVTRYTCRERLRKYYLRRRHTSVPFGRSRRGSETASSTERVICVKTTADRHKTWNHLHGLRLYSRHRRAMMKGKTNGPKKSQMNSRRGSSNYTDSDGFTTDRGTRGDGGRDKRLRGLENTRLVTKRTTFATSVDKLCRGRRPEYCCYFHTWLSVCGFYIWRWIHAEIR